ncbi:hypothetical protein [Pseudomonas sp. Leaf48]|uniref:hypothetical protein n=1 Tax=Pseudomonas sp. Leaf48 TaxID=1736221 RepID=UPI001F42166E|nr:hypothetical protein [Pseudomonas sp. Leaf48]
MYYFILTVMTLNLSGCGQDYSLSPPADSEQITVTVKVPKELIAETMQVIYRSTHCTFTDYTASGKSYQRDEYHRTDIQPERQGNDLYVAKLAVNGGGSCQWRISNVTFGVTYEKPEQFGGYVNSGSGGGVVVVFDHNNSPRGGTGIKVDGDLFIRKDYYPWVKENFIGGYSKRISLAGEGDIYLGYQAMQARQVYFEPVLHSGFVVYSAGPKIKKEGNYTTITYPDGSVETDGRWGPSIRKLQAIRLAAESQQ